MSAIHNGTVAANVGRNHDTASAHDTHIAPQLGADQYRADQYRADQYDQHVLEHPIRPTAPAGLHPAGDDSAA